MSKPKILQVLPALNMGGVEMATLDLSKQLLHLCPDQDIYIASNGGKLLLSFWNSLSEDEKKRFKHFKLPLHSKNPLTILQNAKDLANIVQTYKIDLMHVRSRAPAWSVLRASKKMSIPWIATYHGVYKQNGFLKKCYNQVMIRGNAVIVPSLFLKNHLKDVYQFEDAVVIPEGIDFEKFNPSQPDENLMASLSIPKDSKVFLIPARLTPLKGHKLFLKAFAKIKRNNVIALFLGSGDSSYKKELITLAQKLGVSDRLRWTEESFELSSLYAISFCCVLPSLRPEAFGRVIIESLAMKRPILTSNYGGNAEILRNIPNGEEFLFRLGDDEDLFQKMDATLNTLNTAFLEDAYHFVHENFSLQKMAQQTLDLYQRVIYNNGDVPETVSVLCD